VSYLAIFVFDGHAHAHQLGSTWPFQKRSKHESLLDSQALAAVLVAEAELVRGTCLQHLLQLLDQRLGIVSAIP
jgi:hypothetical protein